jgi:hypothetical protein
MPTVSKEIADVIVAKQGRYEDDPLVVKVVEYDNLWGGQGYGLVYAGDNPDNYQASPYVLKPRVYWKKEVAND